LSESPESARLDDGCFWFIANSEKKIFKNLLVETCGFNARVAHPHRRRPTAQEKNLRQ
jgi:hypothetical protein